ncbi:MAG: carboxymuconolactone decarboxylase family protein [Planctomycetota bacterium]
MNPQPPESLEIQRVSGLCRIALAVAQARSDRLDAALAVCASAPEISDRDVEEAILQGIPYAGFPGAVEALGAWRALAGAASSEAESGPSIVSANATRRDQGAALFHEVYGDVDARVLGELRRRHEDLESWILEFAYGRVLCRPHLPLPLREALGVASLLAQGRRAPLHSHLRGALRCGLPQADLLALLDALADWCDDEVIDFARERVRNEPRKPK